MAPEGFDVCAEADGAAEVAAELEEAGSVGRGLAADFGEVGGLDGGGGAARFGVELLTFEIASICMIPPYEF